MSAARAFAKEIAEIVAAELRGQQSVAKELYTVDEAAAFLSCSEEQVRRFLAQAKLPCVRIDSRPRIQRIDLMRLIEDNKQ